jgi:hypothetical protein
MWLTTRLFRCAEANITVGIAATITVGTNTIDITAGIAPTTMDGTNTVLTVGISRVGGTRIIIGAENQSRVERAAAIWLRLKFLQATTSEQI